MSTMQAEMKMALIRSMPENPSIRAPSDSSVHKRRNSASFATPNPSQGWA